MINIDERAAKVVEVTLSKELSRGDIRQLRSVLEGYSRKSMRPYLLLFAKKDFHGWYGAGPWWSDLGLNDECGCTLSFKRIAMIGEGNWKKWMDTFVGSFTSSEMKFFTPEEIEIARTWLNEHTINPKS